MARHISPVLLVSSEIAAKSIKHEPINRKMENKYPIRGHVWLSLKKLFIAWIKKDKDEILTY